MNFLLLISIIMFTGLIFGRIVKFIKLPNVTGYLIAGLLIGPSVLNIINEETLHSLTSVSEMSLAFIAFTIGLSFKMSYFKRVGFTPVVIAACEALLAVAFVTGSLLLFGFDPAFSIVLGSIAAATAPAATIMIIKQYRAKGPVTETLMSVVAIDDAAALILFGFAVTVAKIMTGSGSENMILSILKPFYEIIVALLIGLVVAILSKIPLKFFKKSGNRLIILIGTVFISSALASFAGVSALLACMMHGAVLCNISADSDMMGDLADFITPPLFLMFFVVSGAELDISVIPTIGIVGIIYVVVRVIGKWVGAFVGAKIMKAPKNICKYIGPTLIPQAGVAIGLSLIAAQAVPEHAQTIRAVILCATFVYEIIGPAVTKITLQKAGEITAA